MKVTMTEHFQGTGISAVTSDGSTVSILIPGIEYEVDSSLGAWLIENKKAVSGKVGNIHDVTPQFEEVPPENPQPEKKVKRGKYVTDTD